MAADARKVGKAAAGAVAGAAKKAVPVVREAAHKAAPLIKQAAEKAAPVVEGVAGRAAHAARSAVDRVREGYRASAAERELRGGATPGVGRGVTGANATVRDVGAGAASGSTASSPASAAPGESGAATGHVAPGSSAAAGRSSTGAAEASAARPGHPQRADGRPQVSVDDATGQPVQTEVYVINEDGTRDYDVFPRDNPTRTMGPIARRIAGLVLVLAGIPMLVLPGPGLIAIAAGLALMGGADPAQAVSSARSASSRPTADGGRRAQGPAGARQTHDASNAQGSSSQGVSSSRPDETRS